jgi:hypothetical protein
MTHWSRLALWSAVLHGAWEYAQCPPFYDMADTGPAEHHALMASAVAGDIPISLGVAAVAERLAGREAVRSMTPRGALALLDVGAVAAVGLEWAAQRLGLWRYTDRMLSVHVAGHEAGVMPVVQVTVLPALAVWAARRGGTAGSPEPLAPASTV